MEFYWNRASAWIKERAHYFQPIPNKLEDLEKFLYSILKILLVLIILFYVSSILYWTLERDNNLYIEPFRTGGPSQDIDGSAMAVLLQNQMQTIREMSKFDDRMSIELRAKPMKIIGISTLADNTSVMDITIPLAIPIDISPLEEVYISSGQKDLDDSLERLGSINIEGTSFSIGQLILSMRDLRGNRPEPISCSIQDFGSGTSITGIYHDSKNTRQTFTWNVRDASQKQNNATYLEIPLLIEDLAFEITHSLGKSKSKENQTYPQNWLTFKKLIQSREAYKTYSTNRSIVYLDGSMSLLSEAYSLEPYYEGSLRKSMLYALGSAYLYEGEYSKSERLFKELSVLEPEIGYYGLASVYYEANDLEKSLNYINKLIFLNSEENADAWLIKGLILTSKLDYANAITSLDKAIDHDPTLEGAWFLKGMISFERVMDESIMRDDKLEMLDRNNMNDALFSFNRTIELNQNNSWALFSKGRILRDEAPQEALELFNRTIALDPSNAFAWNERGNSLMILGRYEEALDAKNIALDISPDRYNFWSDKGILYMMNRHEEAQKCFQIAHELGA